VISVEQIKAARRLIGWTQARLSRNSGVSENTIQRYEKGVRRTVASTLAKIERAFEVAGVEFTHGERPGVRIRGVPLATPVEETQPVK
jgi:transcriptional regulator with XRE-family HTH domain